MRQGQVGISSAMWIVKVSAVLICSRISICVVHKMFDTVTYQHVSVSESKGLGRLSEYTSHVRRRSSKLSRTHHSRSPTPPVSNVVSVLTSRGCVLCLARVHDSHEGRRHRQ